MVLDMDINSLYYQNWGGFKNGELVLISTPRQTGKSMLWDIEATDGIWKNTKVKEPKYKFSRAKWYSHTVNLTPKEFDKLGERIAWCEQHFGDEPQHPDAWSRWYVNYTTIKFRDEKDYAWYMLRWS